MEAYRILEALLQLLGMKAYGCLVSSKGSPLLSPLSSLVARSMSAQRSRWLTWKSYPCQIIQVPADGLRDGNLGDDEFIDCAQEGLQIDILPCMTLRAPPFTLLILTSSRNASGFPTEPPAAADSPPRRNEKHLAPTRPLLHLPPRLFHVAHWDCVGNRIYHFGCGHRAPDTALCLCSFSCCLAPRGHRRLFSCREAFRPGHCRTARAEETTGFIYAGRRGGTTGVWVLF